MYYAPLPAAGALNLGLTYMGIGIINDTPRVGPQNPIPTNKAPILGASRLQVSAFFKRLQNPMLCILDMGSCQN